MLAPSPLATTTWPIPADVPDLLAIVTDQAETITAAEALLHAYQGVLNAQQSLPSPPPVVATGTGTATGTQLAVTAVTGTIMNGAVLTDGVTVPANTTILGQITGTTGGAGTYLTSNPTTANATAVTFTFTPPPPASTWPLPQDAPTLTLITQQQTAIIRNQTALLQHYQDLLNTSETPAPPIGP